MNIESMLKKTEKEIQYDEKAKRIIGNKMILAYILKNTVDEFREMDPKIIQTYIEGDPYISQVLVEPGMTNSGTESLIVGNNTENYELNEGMVRFDIVFYVRMQDGISQIIINIEIQKDKPSTYSIGNRAVFYVSRLISSQKERDFVHSDYDNLKPVYSIWICMNMKEDSLNHVRLVNKSILGKENWKGNFDLPNIILIGLSKEEKDLSEDNELHRLLRTMFSMEMTADEKISVLKEEGIREGLREGIQEGIQEGLAKGAEEERTRIVNSMYQSGMSIEQIASIVKQSEGDVTRMLA